MNKNSCFDYLNNNQKEIINNYLTFRDNNGVVSFDGFKAKKYISNKEKTLKILKSEISCLFFRIICGRCSIKSSKSDFNQLTPEERKQFNPDVFDPINIEEEDYFFISKERSPTTLHSTYKKIKPFYYWILGKLDKKADEDNDKFREFRRTKKNVMAFLEQFPTNESEYPNDIILNKKVKSFLTREEMIIIYNMLLKNIKAFNPIRDASAWQLTCTTGIRPEEIINIRIEHFQLNAEGLIELNYRGWGILDLPAQASKRGMSPSHALYKTPVPYETVKQLNKYLTHLYLNQGKNVPKGKGYLFRPDVSNIERPYKKNFMWKIMNKMKPHLDFLSIEQRRDFELKAGRRSMNNLIMGPKVTLLPEDLNGKVQEMAANYQMRHKPNQTIAEKHYTQEISEDDYYRVLEHTINFPWNLKELEKWELKYGYKKPLVTSTKDDTTTKLPEEKTATATIAENNLTEVVSKLENQLHDLRVKPKGMTARQWMIERNQIKKEIRRYTI
ncbi:hypothetical protein BKP35_08515 [Anaerobacillus arseniciselenatis]|uniref:Uncharacterized protein n=1 Tax=Anaerobacillus arseniciselenatis TaxID=85682 RepID=A0A1S2LMS4_9BACI|nr:hypothetical protein [Anaerobacillus arseniciselenatis]OIJ13812.1 hypothetical protein BKP35_08515 [Anaerobacillus arseniciselenatis]